MSNIKSSIGSRQVRPGRTFQVTDPDMDLSQFDNLEEGPPQQLDHRDVTKMREQAKRSAQELQPQAKTRLDVLLGLGRIFKEVPLDTPQGKITFTLKTLKAKESSYLLKHTLKLPADQNGNVFINDLRIMQLAFQLHAVDGIEIDDALDTIDSSDEERLRTRINLLNEFDNITTVYLYNKCAELTNEQREKYGMNTPEAAKEVAEDISKSGKAT